MKIRHQAISHKKMTSDWLAKSEASFLAENSLMSYFHFNPKPTMPLLVAISQM